MANQECRAKSKCKIRMLIDAIDCAHSKCEFMWKRKCRQKGSTFKCFHLAFMNCFCVCALSFRFKNSNLETAIKLEKHFSNLDSYCSTVCALNGIWPPPSPPTANTIHVMFTSSDKQVKVHTSWIPPTENEFRLAFFFFLPFSCNS